MKYTVTFSCEMEYEIETFMAEDALNEARGKFINAMNDQKEGVCFNYDIKFLVSRGFGYELDERNFKGKYYFNYAPILK